MINNRKFRNHLKSELKHVVAAGHPVTTQVAGDILQAGGNAFDAIIAAGFASTMTESSLTSLGGGGFLLAHCPNDDNILFDFFSNTPGAGLPASEKKTHFLPITVHFPSSEQIFNIDLGAAAVPGVLKGYLHVHQRLGRLPLSDIIAPAIKLARFGSPLNNHQAYTLGLLRPIMTLTRAGNQLFMPEGYYLQEGDVFKNPDLAGFLESLISKGSDDFYQGEIAQHIASDMIQGQGLVTQLDLENYQVIERTPLTIDYRDYQIMTNPAPSVGGTLIALAFKLLNAHQLPPFGTVDYIDLLANVMAEVDHQRETEIKKMSHHSPLSTSGTTHISVCDKEGNVASMTTSNGEGSGYIIPNTGIMLNNMLGEDDLHPDGFHAALPGQRVASMMSPSILFKDNRVQLALGSGGSKRIRSAMMQVLSNIIDYNMDLIAAVKAPRIHLDEGVIQMEPSFQDVTTLSKKWSINVWKETNLYFGGVHAASPAGIAAGDPRRGGAGKVF